MNGRSPRPRMCIHHIYEQFDCEKCEGLVASGKMLERKIYSQQRVWQLEQRATKRCEICGGKKGNCPSATRCAKCLVLDADRHRKKIGTKRKWIPGDAGRPRHIPGREENFRRARAARDRRKSELVQTETEV